jgi:electron transport complex protein RnfB
MPGSLFAIGLFGTVFGLGMAFAARKFFLAPDPSAEQIDRMLPQTQCGQCGYAGCRPYAEAIASGEAEINQCPPGGEAGIQALASLLSRAALPLNPENGVTQPARIALIDEQACIGCTLCIQACPVDAILGASKQMHTVIADECTGCELCLPPCPVDCIDMVLPALAGLPDEAHGPGSVPARSARELPCINCGACAAACPASLSPQTLLWQIRQGLHDATLAAGLSDCSECGICNLVCPSHIDLLAWMRFGQSELRALAARRLQSDVARQRYTARAKRLTAIEDQHRQRMEQKKSVMHDEAEKKRRIAEALARVQGRGAAAGDAGRERGPA